MEPSGNSYPKILSDSGGSTAGAAERRQVPFLVRGAPLACSSGTHTRRLNLPLCHGVYAGGHPLVHKGDCRPGANISPFGICRSATPPPATKGQTITLPLEDANGVVRQVTGQPCLPMILGMWRCCHPSALIATNESLEAAGDDPFKRVYAEALTTESFLVCNCDGLIEPLESGQSWPAVKPPPTPSNLEREWREMRLEAGLDEAKEPPSATLSEPPAASDEATAPRAPQEVSGVIPPEAPAEGPHQNVLVTFGDGIDGSQVAPKTINILRLLAYESGVTAFQITSALRTPESQARAMFDNIRNDGGDPQKQEDLYGDNGDKVIGEYRKLWENYLQATNNDRSAALRMIEANAGMILDTMVRKIYELEPQNVSKHCYDPEYYKAYNTVDIGVGSVRPKGQTEAFSIKLKDAETTGRINNYEDEKSSNGCYHVEIRVY